MTIKAAAKRQALPDAERLTSQYGCGPVQFAGTDEALYERHLLFDSGVDLAAATARDRFEALARSVRDILSQRWLLTEKTYEQQNPKRLYYLSMEFLIGRSLANNVTNLLLAPLTDQGHRGQETQPPRDIGAGARCRPGQRRAWTFGSLLHGIRRHHATPGHGLRTAI